MYVCLLLLNVSTVAMVDAPKAHCPKGGLVTVP